MYVDGLLAKDQNLVHIAERVNGQRVYREFEIDYSFYVEDPAGKYQSIYGHNLEKITPKSKEEFNKLKRIHSTRKQFESDSNLLFRCLEQNYRFTEAPKLHVAFFDIETGFDMDLGYSSPEAAFNPVTSIAVHLQWLNQTVCLALAPPSMTYDEAQKIANTVDNVILFNNEKRMLETFLTLIEDCDVLSGWNSEFYDIPYLINRIAKLLGKHEVRKFCLWNQLPKKRNVISHGKEEVVYELVGRISMDYLQLYKKYNYEERQSYSLNAIAEAELKERKVDYDGSLDQLYKRDFKKFLEYNIQDTMLLDKLDRKLKFIELANFIAHDSCVLIPATMGTVSMVEQAITVEAHSSNKIMPNRNYRDSINFDEEDFFDRKYSFDEDDEDDDSNRAAGGWVMKPNVGLHKWIANSDINSLYPSTIRALNMSPETIVGQLRTSETDRTIEAFIASAKRHTFSEWWNDRFTTLEMQRFFDNNNQDLLWFDVDGGESVQLTGAELRKLVFDPANNWMISANGTVFRTDVEGVVPKLLSRWYAERKQLQKKKSGFTDLNSGDININDL